MLQVACSSPHDPTGQKQVRSEMLTYHAVDGSLPQSNRLVYPVAVGYVDPGGHQVRCGYISSRAQRRVGTKIECFAVDHQVAFGPSL